MGRHGHAWWSCPSPAPLLPARGSLRQVLALAPMLAVAHLARGDADEADGPCIVELVPFVAIQTAGEIVSQLSHRHWGGMAWVRPHGSITP